MDFSNNKVLITGGSSGIGLELAQRLLQKNNKVIICGRSEKKLLEAKKHHLQLEIFRCDLSIERECRNLSDWIKEHHSDVNVLINNAAVVHRGPFMEDSDALQNAEFEMQVNFMAPLRLIKSLYPVLEKNNKPTIVNVTSGLAYVPRADYSIYNATKAALHSFTQVLRIQLNTSRVNIVEVMFPAVNTPWHKGNPPKIAISAQAAVDEMIQGLEKGKTEIKIGKVKLLYRISRVAPKFALKKVNTLQNT